MRRTRSSRLAHAPDRGQRIIGRDRSAHDAAGDDRRAERDFQRRFRHGCGNGLRGCLNRRRDRCGHRRLGQCSDDFGLDRRRLRKLSFLNHRLRKLAASSTTGSATWASSTSGSTISSSSIGSGAPISIAIMSSTASSWASAASAVSSTASAVSFRRLPFPPARRRPAATTASAAELGATASRGRSAESAPERLAASLQQGLSSTISATATGDSSCATGAGEATCASATASQQSASRQRRLGASATAAGVSSSLNSAMRPASEANAASSAALASSEEICSAPCSMT